MGTLPNFVKIRRKSYHLNHTLIREEKSINLFDFEKYQWVNILSDFHEIR